MATSTTNYSFTLPEVGGDTDQWGTQLNSNWTLADSTLKTIEDSVVDVTLTGNDYLTISGQAITVGDVDLTTDVTGTLPVGSGGTGLAALGSANQVLGVNSGGTALEYKTLSTGGTVTSVAVTGSDGIEIDSGSPITSSGTIAVGINSTSLSTHLGLGSLATQSSVTESQISDLGSYITASSTDTLTNKSGNISQWTNDSGYLTAETNNLSTVSGTLGTANGGTGLTAIGTTNQVLAVNSGATALEFQTISITESQISDLQTYLTASSTATLTNKSGNISQWTNDSGYLTAESNNLSTVSGTLGTANGGTGLTAIGTANQVLAVNSGATALEFQTISITESQISDLQTYLTASSTATLTNKSGNISQWTNDSGYLTAETNNLSTVSGTLGTANGGTGLTAIGTAGQVLRVNSGATALEFADESGGGGLSDLEHANSISTTQTVASGQHRFYVGPITFSNDVTIAGKLLVFDGLYNQTSSTANVTGTLNIRG